MALVAEFTCNHCGEHRHEVVTRERVCLACRTKEEDETRRRHFAGLKGLTPDERLSRLERENYEMKQQLAALQASNARY